MFAHANVVVVFTPHTGAVSPMSDVCRNGCEKEEEEGHWDQIPPPPLPADTGAVSGHYKGFSRPPAAAAGLTSLRIHSMVSRPAPLRLTTLSPSLTQTHLSGVSTQSLLTTEH